MSELLYQRGQGRGILVYFEYRKEIIHPIGLQILGKAYELSQIDGSPIFGVVIGKNVIRAKEQLLHKPLDKVYLYEAEDILDIDIYHQILTKCIKEMKPSIVLMGSTKEGRTLAPITAITFKTGLTADCTDLRLNNDNSLVQIRPAFGGDIMAEILTTEVRPQFATVRFDIMEALQQNFSIETEFIESHIGKDMKSRIEIQKVVELTKERGIEEAKVLVAGGKGIKKKQDMDMLKELAFLLGGEVAGTRALVEKGFLPHERQIGLSGKTVRPDLLITCGLSGSIQFITGMKHSSHIISINTDEKANIFQFAQYPILGDLYEIIPNLIEQIKDHV